MHRNLGWLYVLAVAIGSFGGFYLALTIPSGAFVYAVGLFFLSVAWAITTAMAIWSIKRHAVEQHRDWMLRSYIVTFAFVTFRLGGDLLRAYFDQPPGMAPDDIESTMAWACWAVPLLVAEPFIQRRNVR